MLQQLRKLTEWIDRQKNLGKLRRYMDMNQLPHSLYPWTDTHDVMMIELSEKGIKFFPSVNAPDRDKVWAYTGDIKGNFYYTKAHAVQAAYMHHFGFSATSRKFGAIPD